MRLLGRAFLLALGLLVVSNALLPAVARAQWAAAGGASVADVLTALVGQDVAATRYTVSATTGAGYTCNSNLTSCLKMPGTDMVIGSDGTQILIGPTASTTITAKIGANLRFMGSGTAEVNGPLDQYNAGYLVNTIGGAVKVDDAQGLTILPKDLTAVTCAAGTEGYTLRDVLAGAVTGSRTRLCMCVSDGAGAYKWHNLGNFGDTSGTTTACPN